MFIHRKNTFNLKIFKNQKVYSKLIHFINWPIEFNLKILKDLENFNKDYFFILSKCKNNYFPIKHFPIYLWLLMQNFKYT